MTKCFSVALKITKTTSFVVKLPEAYMLNRWNTEIPGTVNILQVHSVKTFPRYRKHYMVLRKHKFGLHFCTWLCKLFKYEPYSFESAMSQIAAGVHPKRIEMWRGADNSVCEQDTSKLNSNVPEQASNPSSQSEGAIARGVGWRLSVGAAAPLSPSSRDGISCGRLADGSLHKRARRGRTGVGPGEIVTEQGVGGVGGVGGVSFEPPVPDGFFQNSQGWKKKRSFQWFRNENVIDTCYTHATRTWWNCPFVRASQQGWCTAIKQHLFVKYRHALLNIPRSQLKTNGDGATEPWGRVYLRKSDLKRRRLSWSHPSSYCLAILFSCHYFKLFQV